MTNFNEIIKEYHPILYKIGRSYTRTDTAFDDLYQEMLIHIYQSLKNFKGEAKLSTWIYRVSLNTALTFSRNQNNHRKELPIDDAEHVSIEQSGSLSEKEKAIELLYKCINELKKDDRAIILLYLEGKQYDEIAEITGISKSNTGVKIMRIRKQLQELLIKNGYERY